MNFGNRLFASALAFAGTLLCAAPASSLYAQSAPSGFGPPPAVPQITQPVNPAQYTAMANNVRPEANAANDLGRVADSLPLNNMLLLLHRPDVQEKALENFMAQQQDPKSPNYHNWLTSQQVGEFGPAVSDINTTVNWLQAQGFTVNRVGGDGMTIDFSGNAGQVRQAFKTEVHNLKVDGVAHFANMSVPQIPAALAPAVVGIASINDFHPHTNVAPKPQYTITVGSTYALVPADLQTIYNISPLLNGTPTIDGSGQTIVLLEEEDPYNSTGNSNPDVNTFRSTFGLPTLNSVGGPTYTETHPGCTDPGNSNDGTDAEVELDIEWAGAAAPNANLVMASCGDSTTFGVLTAANNLNTANDSARLWSISYGSCEALTGATLNAAFTTTYQTAAARGVSVFVASGDQGAASCDAGDNNGSPTHATHGIGVSSWTDTAYNVSVGGTDFGDRYAGTLSTYWGSTNSATYGSALSYINEIPWDSSCAGGLVASYLGKPAYGSTDWCNTTGSGFLNIAAGSGGPSGCATGTPSTSGVVSGTCAGRTKPSFQSGMLGNPTDGVRDIPDVSLFAASGFWGHYYVFCWSNPGDGGTVCTGAPSGWSGAGGTSFASPILAGIQALVNQQNSPTGTGNPNPTYYSLAATEYGASGSSTCNSSNGNAVGTSCIFYDVTQGDIAVPCTGTHNCYLPSGTYGVLSTSNSSYTPAYGTGTGWDFATGLGTVNACNLVNGWTGTPGSLVCYTAGPAAKLVFAVEPSASYTANAPIAVKVSIEDANGNVVTTDTSTVALTLSGGTAGATLGGTVSTAAVAGVATFSNLAVNKVGTAYVLNATDGSLTGAASTPFNITVGAPATIAFALQPGTNANITAGSTIPLIAQVTDSGGNPISGDSVTLAIGNNPGSSTLSVTTNPVTTDASGNASFSNLSLNKAGTGYTLTASDATPLTATSNSFNIVAGAATQLVFTTQPANVVAPSTLNTIAVTEEDSNGNTVTSDSTTSVNFTVSACGGTALGSATMSGGVATLSPAQVFSTLRAGLTVSANDPTLSLSAISQSFNVDNASPSDLLFTDGFEACAL